MSEFLTSFPLREVFEESSREDHFLIISSAFTYTTLHFHSPN